MKNGRQLSKITKSGSATTYKYNADGMRIKKVNSQGTSLYYYDDENNLIMANFPSQYGENILRFYYDEQGVPNCIQLNRTTSTGEVENLRYYYVTNLQGDVTGIANSDGTLRANYQYDAWGKLISINNESGVAITDDSHVGLLNPLRYRSYVYDDDSGLYYLQSRYYDPTTCRFINGDQTVDTGTGLLGTNMFSYCYNNPVIYYDIDGRDAIVVYDKGFGLGHLSLLIEYNNSWYFFLYSKLEVILMKLNNLGGSLKTLPLFNSYWKNNHNSKNSNQFSKWYRIKKNADKVFWYCKEKYNKRLCWSGVNWGYNILFNNCAQVVIDALNKIASVKLCRSWDPSFAFDVIVQYFGNGKVFSQMFNMFMKV